MSILTVLFHACVIVCVLTEKKRRVPGWSSVPSCEVVPGPPGSGLERWFSGKNPPDPWMQRPKKQTHPRPEGGPYHLAVVVGSHRFGALGMSRQSGFEGFNVIHHVRFAACRIRVVCYWTKLPRSVLFGHLWRANWLAMAPNSCSVGS